MVQPVGYATPGIYGGRPLPNRAATFSVICACSAIFLVVLAVNLAARGAHPSSENPTIVAGVLAMLCPIFAIVFGILGLVKSRKPDVTGKGKAIAGISLGGAELVLMVAAFGLLMPSISRARETTNRARCALNLKEIGVALKLYANDNKGQYPPRPEDLMRTQDIFSDYFICPGSNDSKAPGATPQQQAAQLSAGGHDSYIYLGEGMTDRTAGARFVLVYEPMVDHKQGFNALFGDGHVEFIGLGVAQKVQAELQVGKNPPPSFR